MMNTKLILSGLSIVTAMALMAGGTFAYFSDTGTSTGNVFGTGTFDLKLSDNNETVQDNVTQTWSSNTLVPGGTGVTATLKLRNSGTINGDHVDFKAANVITDNGTTEDADPMSKHLQITAITYDGTNILGLITDTNGNGHADLQDLESATDGVNIGSLTDLNMDHSLTMTVALDSATDNTYQGDQVTTTFTATLDQSASQ